MHRLDPAAPSRALIDQDVRRAAALLATDPGSADRAATAVLRLAPNDPRALLIHGSALRRLGQTEAARTVLEPLAKTYPRAANTQFEFGAVLNDLGRGIEAIEVLRGALGVNPQLTEAWRLIGDALVTQGRAGEAEEAYRASERARITDPELKSIADALHRGDQEQGENALRAFMLRRPRHLEGLRLLAKLSAQQQRHGAAEILFAEALAIDEHDADARFGLATALFRQQKAIDALGHAERLLRTTPADPAYQNLVAACYGLLGENDRVIEIYQALSSRFPQHAGVWLNFGHALRTIGRRDDAVEAYRTCLRLETTNGEAYWSLANLKVVPFAPDEVDAMQAELLGEALSETDRLHLHYALGKAFEDTQDYARSFNQYAKGARIRRGQIFYDAEETSAFTNRAIRFFTPQFFAARQGGGYPSRAPIFIVGLPRAGSTLVEQILASHSEVEGTMELPEIALLSRQLGGAGGDDLNSAYPEVLETLPLDRFEALGHGFIDDTMVYRKLRLPRFIDKMPNNFQHLGLIHLILPNAKIIDVRRSPMAACFAAFKQHFNQGQTFSYDLADLGRYYADYVALMTHFQSVLPGKIHRVIYEDLVNDTEAEIRRLLDFCNLPFEPACVAFHENKRAVRTVSSEQVRRPIFRKGLDQWRHYEPFLDQLRTALGDARQNWRDG